MQNDSTDKKTEDLHPDLATLDQLEGIRSEISANQPMISCLVSPSALLPDYQGNGREMTHVGNGSSSVGFVSGIQYLANHYPNMRKVRGDGNCFYRAFLFAYLEELLQQYQQETTKTMAEKELERMTSKVQGSLMELVEVGYSEFAIETFHEELLELLGMLFVQSRETLWEMFQEGGKADYLTWFMRVLTAGHLKRDADRFLPFVEGLYFDIHAYCAAEVEPMNKECEHMQILALSEYLGIPIDIAYLDGRLVEEAVGLNVVKFLEDERHQATANHCCPFVVHLLYRPGHYDVLYIR